MRRAALADAGGSFAPLIHIPQPVGIGVIGVPFDMMDENAGNTWKGCIGEFLAALIPPPDARTK